MNKNIQKNLLSGIVILAVVVVFFIGSRESSIIKDKQSIKITGLYSTEINLEDMKDVEIRNSIPKVHRKINALNFLNIKKGTFSIDEFDRARLYLHANDGPYLYLHTDEQTIILNFKILKRHRRNMMKL
ncbi:hypothetical protein [Candidatus Contubernalis alkaliaceticus]|uniref:hypothetical protein n=1 Tax=Candidatus Contubernalis alkaliaceticus TaxID=338645 RepID=UPI001F4BD1A0|nr:hypothetical protein [Candidatus Contubernalis alkalaceticus]UNC90812.1 hypothetical protein HUE98_01150 [Candidatus Contubernalis alkalaceticus]